MAFGGSGTLEHLLVPAQRDRMDEVTTISQQDFEQDILDNSVHDIPLLDCRNNGQFSLFSQHQRLVPQNTAVGSIVPRSVVDCGRPFPHVQHQNEV